MEKLIDYLLTEFQSVNDFSNDWVASTIDSNFTEFDAISAIVRPSFNDIDPTGREAHFKKLSRYLKKFGELSDDSSQKKLWKEMEEKDVPGKKLALLLWYSIEAALAKDSDSASLSCGIAASNAYLYLCCVKGAQVYTIFNPYLYQKCLDLYRELYRSIMYESREIAQSKKGKGKGAKGKGKLKIDHNTSEENGDAPPKLDRNEVTELLELALTSLFMLFDKVALSAFPEVAISTVRLVRDLSQIDSNREFRVKSAENCDRFQLLDGMTEKAFALMHRLTEDKHSHGGELVYGQCVYPRLAFWDFTGHVIPSSSSIPSSFNKWKDAMIEFIAQRIKLQNDSEYAVILKVLENLYCRCTDRQDYRSRVAAALVQVLSILPKETQCDFIQRVHVFSHSPKNANRNFSCEVVPLILKTIDLTVRHNATNNISSRATSAAVKSEAEDVDMSNNDSNNEDEEDERVRRKLEAAKKKKRQRGLPVIKRVEPLIAMYQCIVRNAIDKSSSVRGRGILHLSSILADPAHSDSLLKTAADMLLANAKLFSFKPDRKKRNNDEQQEDVEMEDLNDSELEIDNLMLHIIVNGLEDDKANVRKSAISAAQSYCPLLDAEADFTHLIEVVQKRCVDSSVMVRRQAAESLTDLLTSCQKFRCELEGVWLKSVLPMINDREQNAQQSAARLITDVIITPLLGNTTAGAWSLMHRIEQEDNHRRLLLRSLFNESREGKINKKIVDVLYKKLDSNPEHDSVIWMMLAQSSIVFKLDPRFAVDAWFNTKTEEENSKVRYVAMVLSSCTDVLDVISKKSLLDDISSKLRNYEISARSISSVYLCLAKLMNAVGENAPGWTLLKEFGSKVLTSCRRELRNYLQEFGNQLDLSGEQTVESIEAKFVRVISTVGEVIQFSPMLINACDELVSALKTIMASDVIQADPEFKDKLVINSQVPTLNPTPADTRPATAMSSQVLTQPVSSQPIIPLHLMDVDNVLTGAVFTSTVRAYCVLVIGKFCLMDEQLAKKCVPALVHQLKVNADHVVRNNIVLVISDLCIRYTLLVDRYSPIVASCLKDRSTLVRFQTLESLTNLIKEQFIRWEGQIMYRFVSAILDEDKTIRDYARFCLKEVLLLQFPTMFFQHFIECLIYFNEVPPSFMPGSSNTEEDEVDSSVKFSLSGRKNVENRRTIYNFMLETFEDKEKFTTMANICTQILRPIYSGELDLNDCRVTEMLKDAFLIMSSKAIELNMDVGKGNDDDEDEPPAQVLTAAKKMITDTFRIGIIQLIMPPLLDMREFLTEKRSPLLRGLFSVLRAICKQHQEQIEEVLAGDKQLMSEILHDIRLLESKEKAEKIATQRRIDEEQKERRRTRRSMAAAQLLINNIPNTTSQQGNDVQMTEAAELQPTRNGADYDMPQNSEATVARDDHPQMEVAESQTSTSLENTNVVKKTIVNSEATVARDDHPQMEVAESQTSTSLENTNVVKKTIVNSNSDKDVLKEVKEEPLSCGEENEETQQASTQRSSKRLSGGKKSDKPDVLNTADGDDENIEPSSEAVANEKRRQSGKEKPALGTEFAAPCGAIKRKRTPASTLLDRTVKTEVIDPNESIVVAGRAISTPKKDHNNLTFADLDVSAIALSETFRRPSRSQGRRNARSTRNSMGRIDEDKMDD